MPELTLISAFLAGLLGGGHCSGMPSPFRSPANYRNLDLFSATTPGALPAIPWPDFWLGH